MQVGTIKDQGLYNKPSDAVHPGALAAGTLPQYKVNNAIYGAYYFVCHALVINGRAGSSAVVQDM